MVTYILTKKLSCAVLILFVATNCYSQTDTIRPENYDALSLKDLLNIKIVSVSKKPEWLFDAPLSASVITKEDIRKAGSTSIMEALRLVPGMVVREQNNGNYDIHIRGMDNTPPNAPFDGNATTTLVMIDNRPIYNYLKGGTFWETLPVDINDIEKIEVVRGPAAALYGPNAVSGVINIITRHPQTGGLYLVANAKQGSNETFINNASVGYRTKKFNVIASGNYQHRSRTQTSYFEMYRDRWVDHPPYFIGILSDTFQNVDEMYPDQSLAMEKYAGNAFFNYVPSEKTRLSLSAGIQHSIVQTVTTENGVTPFTTVTSNSRYVDARLNINGIAAQFSYNEGTQKTNYDAGQKYDFHTFDVNVEYNYTSGNFSLKPGVSFRSAVYDDSKYSDITLKKGIFNARGVITTQSASLRGEYKLLNDNLRLVAGLSANKFNYPDSTYLSYQLGATYKINKSHLVRAVYSRSPRSSTIYDTYIDQTVSYYQTGAKKFTRLAIENNKNLKLLTADMVELGYRATISGALSIDIELFEIRSKNYNSLVTNPVYSKLNGTDTLLVIPLIPTNLPLTLRQRGITLSLAYINKKLQIKPFLTLQHSRINNYVPFLNMPDALADGIQPDPAKNNIYSGMGNSATIESTPVAFGGAVVNYQFTPKWNGSLNAYYYSNQTYYHASNIAFHDGVRGMDNITAKVILNVNLTYEAIRGLYLSCSAKNILNDGSREFFKADVVPFKLLAGLSYEFNR